MLGREPLTARAVSSSSGPRAMGAKAPLKGRGAKASARAVEFLHEDGTPVDPGHVKDIVFVKRDPATPPRSAGRGRSWWAALDPGIEAGTALGLQGVLFPEERPGERDVVLGDVRMSTSDVDAMLQSLVPERLSQPAVVVDAGFFHRTLSRWLGIDDDAANDSPRAPRTSAPRARATPAVWDYDFWKAALEESGELAAAASPEGRRALGVPKDARVRRFSALVYRGERGAPERFEYWIAVDEKGRIRRSGWLTPPPDLLGGASSSRAFRESGASVDDAMTRLPDALSSALTDPRGVGAALFHDADG